MDTWSRCEEIITKLLDNTMDQKKIDLSESSNVRLPKLEIKKFNGEYHDWQRFYDEYEATINSNSTLSSIEKFNYL
ncbi:hypothetical protein T03_454 [Trichinella britovi]|uniref:Uncharacterized protein n=1 Tax=Trichinella britovi TaxID=45882 RepID=A0A0V1AKT9_TRIBR|nr:hypothetical protein T03_454 [Trichinella britovi]